jgi:hypothetical protein
MIFAVRALPPCVVTVIAELTWKRLRCGQWPMRKVRCSGGTGESQRQDGEDGEQDSHSARVTRFASTARRLKDWHKVRNYRANRKSGAETSRSSSYQGRATADPISRKTLTNSQVSGRAGRPKRTGELRLEADLPAQRSNRCPHLLIHRGNRQWITRRYP